ncbi:SRPBCC domain-containing protein [Flavobacteriaceae bacterium 3-367]|uniref:SRPBCC domain-containing protein n=1 Tax=Eudoraea algarum TaxID=3417568 RepID=UPI0032875EDE
MKHTFTISEVIPASPEVIYMAWLDPDGHSAMTGGGKAIVHDEVDKPFAVHDAYLWGKNLQLIPGKKIVQSWRTTGFETADEDSKIEVVLSPHAEGTLLTLTHSNVPDQEVHVKQGWVRHYFEPMKAYFSEIRSQASG